MGGSGASLDADTGYPSPRVPALGLESLSGAPPAVASESGARGTSSTDAAATGASAAPPKEPSEADILCSEFLAAVQQKTREGYQEALRLSEKILELEPGNRMVHEYQALIGMFLRQMDARVEQDVADAEREAADPNRTPSQVSTGSEEEESEEDDGAED